MTRTFVKAPEQEQSGAENERGAGEPVTWSKICDEVRARESKEREEERVEHDLRGCVVSFPQESTSSSTEFLLRERARKSEVST